MPQSNVVGDTDRSCVGKPAAIVLELRHLGDHRDGQLLPHAPQKEIGLQLPLGVAIEGGPPARLLEAGSVGFGDGVIELLGLLGGLALAEELATCGLSTDGAARSGDRGGEGRRPEHPDRKGEWQVNVSGGSGGFQSVVGQADALQCLHTLGFHLDELSFDEVFKECDSDDDGALLLDEFITCVGMLKKSVLEVHELEKSFTRFRQTAASQLSSAAGRLSSNGRLSGTAIAGRTAAAADEGAAAPIEPQPEPQSEEHRVYAADLVAALGVSEEEAEQMIFIADLQETSSIDFTEFRNLVVNWG
mmetsp:Transcript_30270/g.78638  ORF Transcript_30270/g.78638 Transcript_30270/m.78638 type:complete len:303 (-) Transcript_30270:305-1213(-)